MVLWRFTLREIGSRPGRATLTLLSIVFGVAAVVAVTVSTTTTHKAYEEMYESVTGKAAFEVVVDDEKSEDPFFHQAIVADLDGVAGVRSAVPSIQSVYKIRFENRPIQLSLRGVDLGRAGILDNYELAEGTFFQDENSPEVLLELGFARGLGIRLDDPQKSTIKLSGRKLRGKHVEFRVVGLLAPKRVELSQQGGLMFLPLPVVQYLFDRPQKINRVSLVLDEGADENAVRAAIEERLADPLAVVSPAARSPLAKETLQSAEQGLRFAFALSIMLAIFMIFNTFLMNVGERRRQLAILRAIGTTRRQITRMLLLESLMMGVAGTILGALLGIGGAYFLAGIMSQIYSGSVPALQITPLPFLLVSVLGPAISLVGVYIPAHIAGKITPIEGMRPIVTEGRKKISLMYVALSLVVFAVTGSLLLGCVVGWLPLILMIPFGTAFTGAFVLLIPLVLRHLSQFTAYMLHPLLRVEGQIASRQILRRRARTTLTVGILYIAVSTAVGMGTMIIDNVADVRHWFDATMMGDFFIRPITASNNLAMDTKTRMKDSLGEQIRRIPGVTHLDTLVSVDSKIAGEYVRVVIFDLSDPNRMPLVLKEGTKDEVLHGLAQGEAVLATVLANRTNTHPGGEITLETPKGEKKVRVAGTATSYMVGGKMLYMQGPLARKLFGIEGVGTYMIRTQTGARQAVQSRLQKLCDDQGVMLYSFADLRGKLDALLNGVIGSLWGLMALGFIVGAFGIANTLSMNVLEQTRELALLRVVAMTRKQVRKTILAQAAIIGFIGLFTGSLGGLVGAYTINLCAIPLLGYAVDFVIHPELLAICFLTGMLIILIAAWIPAERAARLNLLIALQYE